MSDLCYTWSLLKHFFYQDFTISLNVLFYFFFTARSYDHLSLSDNSLWNLGCCLLCLLGVYYVDTLIFCYLLWVLRCYHLFLLVVLPSLEVLDSIFLGGWIPSCSTSSMFDNWTFKAFLMTSCRPLDIIFLYLFYV